MNRLSFFLVAGGQYFLHSWRSFILHGLLGKAKHSQISHGYNVTFDFVMNWHFIFLPLRLLCRIQAAFVPCERTDIVSGERKTFSIINY